MSLNFKESTPCIIGCQKNPVIFFFLSLQHYKGMVLDRLSVTVDQTIIPAARLTHSLKKNTAALCMDFCWISSKQLFSSSLLVILHLTVSLCSTKTQTFPILLQLVFLFFSTWCMKIRNVYITDLLLVWQSVHITGVLPQQKTEDRIGNIKGTYRRVNEKHLEETWGIVGGWGVL